MLRSQPRRPLSQATRSTSQRRRLRSSTRWVPPKLRRVRKQRSDSVVPRSGSRLPRWEAKGRRTTHRHRHRPRRRRRRCGASLLLLLRQATHLLLSINQLSINQPPLRDQAPARAIVHRCRADHLRFRADRLRFRQRLRIIHSQQRRRARPHQVRHHPPRRRRSVDGR
jgi:hypothetical protein